MRIQGEIVKKRAYKNDGDPNQNSILFIKVQDEIKVNGDRLKIIPMISSDPAWNVGDPINAVGKIQFQRVRTFFGRLSFSPIPVFIPTKFKNSKRINVS